MGWVIIINGYGGYRFWQPVQADSEPKSSGLVLGRWPLGAILHSSNEPGELSQWLCHDDSTINIVLDFIIIIIIITHADLVYYYQAVTRSVLEYACPGRHSSITSQQSKSLDSIQSPSAIYSDTCSVLGLPSLHVRRQERLRSANKFPVIFASTNRFKNLFTCYVLANYQWLWLVFYCVIVYCVNVRIL